MPHAPEGVAVFVEKEHINVVLRGQLDGVGGERRAGGDEDGLHPSGRDFGGFATHSDGFGFDHFELLTQ